MIVPAGQPIPILFKADPSDGTTPTEFGYVPDPMACDFVDYVQLVDQTDTSYFEFDLDYVLNAEELQNEDMGSTTGWVLGAGWGFAAGVASITSAAGTSSLTQTLWDVGRVGNVYRIIIEVNSITGTVTFEGGTGVSQQLGDGTNTFYMKSPNPATFEIEATLGSSIAIESASVKIVPANVILALWDNDDNYLDELSYAAVYDISTGTLSNNKLVLPFAFAGRGIPDGCAYFTVTDPNFGLGLGQTGLVNGEFNVGKPAVDDMFFWTKNLGAGATIVGGTGICTYASPGGGQSDVTSTGTALETGKQYSFEIKVNSIANCAVTIKVGATATATVTTVGTHTRTLTPAVGGVVVIQWNDSGVAACVLDYVRVSLVDGNDLFTNNASSKIKVGDFDECTHLLKACPGEAFNFDSNYQIRLRTQSKITSSTWAGESFMNRLSTGERLLSYADLAAGRTFTTDWIPYLEQLSVFLASRSKVFQIDGVRYWVDTEPDEFTVNRPDNEDEKGSISLDIVEYDQIYENPNCDGTEPACG